MAIRKEISKILEKNYVKKIFEKKKFFYFPSLKNEKIVDFQIKKESPDWAENSCRVRYKIIFSNSSFKIIRATAHIDGSKKRSFKIMKHLYQKTLDIDFFQIPRPLDYLEEAKACLYEEIEGTSLSFLFEKKRLKSINLIAEKLAQYLFLLHSTKEMTLKAKMFSQNEYQKIFWQIKKILPEFLNLIPRPQKITFLKELKRPSVFSHGDFYPSNIILDKKNRLALIDFDKAGRSHFFVDPLSFNYWFDLPKIQPLKLSFNEIEELKNKFLETYCRLSKLNFIKTKRELEKFKVKTFLDCLHHVTILAFHGWDKIDRKLKEEMRESIKTLLEKINSFL